MRSFDPIRPHTMQLDSAGLRTGDVAQFRGRGLIASWIRWATQGVHTHSGMVRVDPLGRADLLEVREFCGGRAIPLRGAVIEAPGYIDIFRPRTDVFREYDAVAAIELMRSITSRRYGYWGIARLLIQRLPILWRLSRLETRDLVAGTDSRAPFCSHAVCTACRVGGGVDPVPRKPDDLVTPADLTKSLLFDYHCTLIP